VGWKVRSGKLALVKQKVTDKGGRQQVRWEVAQYKIKQALAASGKALEGGLGIADFQSLANQGILTLNDECSIIEIMPELGLKKFSLEAIKNHFISNYQYDIKSFLDDDLKIKNNTSPTWQRFLKGETAIEYETFKTICTVLELDCNEIGMEDEPEIPDSKQLETLLWDLNHRTQVADFQALAQKSHNLVCLKFRSAPGKKIPMFWLLKTLVQSVDNSIQKAEIIFSTQIYSDSTDRLNNIITGLRLPQKLEKKKKPDAIAKEIHKKILKENKTIVLLFFTDERQQSADCQELFNLLHEPLLNELSVKKTEQKLLMVWIDSQPLSQGESDAFDEDYDNHQNDSLYTKIDVSPRFNNSDIMEWINRQDVKTFINKTRNSLLNDNIADIIWNESQEGQPEFLLESVYNLCNLKWEEHQRSWQKL